MKRIQILGFLLFGCTIIMGLYFTIDIIIEKEEKAYTELHMTNQDKDFYQAEQSSEISDGLNDGKIDNLKSEHNIIDDGNSDAGDPLDDNTDESKLAGDTPQDSSNVENKSDDSSLAGNESGGDNIAGDNSDGNQYDDNKSDDNKSDGDKNDGGTPGDNKSEGDNPLTNNNDDSKQDEEEDLKKEDAIETFAHPLEDENFQIELIKDCNLVDYKKYLPEVVMDPKMEVALDIDSPSISINAGSALLMNINTGDIVYQKNAAKIIFPASTAKLLTSLVVLDFCYLDEEVLVGEEVKLIASDSSKANLKVGYKMSIYQLLEAMLIPSGNDSAYALATYVGRKVLANPEAETMDAIKEFVRLMNMKAKELGLINSCFMTPDGYDALGQYTTAYDMALIGLAAYRNKTIVEICEMSKASVTLLSGEQITWNTTNGLIKRDSSNYYSNAIGLKTGTSSMAGRCIITVGKANGKEYLAVVMNSSSTQRFNDAKKLLRYVLN